MQNYFLSKNKITNFLSVIFIATIGIANAQILEIKPNDKTPWKSPSTASLQSLILPGAGYLYQDKLALGYSVMGTELLLGGLGAFFITKDVSSSGRIASSVREEKDRNRAIAGGLFAALGGIHLFQFVHSGILAHKSNKVNGYVKRDLDIKIYSKGLGAAVLLSF
jgi:hypothetical protein